MVSQAKGEMGKGNLNLFSLFSTEYVQLENGIIVNTVMLGPGFIIPQWILWLFYFNKIEILGPFSLNSEDLSPSSVSTGR
jgi:hypothetical protein